MTIYRHWTKGDVSVLKKHAKKTPARAIGRKHLSCRRTESAVRQKAQNLGIALTGGRAA